VCIDLEILLHYQYDGRKRLLMKPLIPGLAGSVHAGGQIDRNQELLYVV
jgi:hypothetical protein